MLTGTDGHFLGTTARWDEAHTGLDESQVRLGCGLNARAMKADFAAAPEGHSLGSDDNGLRGVLEGEIGVLKAAHGVVNVVPFLFLRGDEQKHQVSAHGKIGRLIGDNQRIKIGVQALQAGLHHRGDVVADSVHLGVKFAA